MHRAHTADTRPATIFIHNGAPQALVGSQGGNRVEEGRCLSGATYGDFGVAGGRAGQCGGGARLVLSAGTETRSLSGGAPARSCREDGALSGPGELVRASPGCFGARLEATR